MKQKWRNITHLMVVLLVILLLAGCSESDNTEGIIVQLEAYLYASANGDASNEPPLIQHYQDDKRAAIVNGLSFDIVLNREEILIDYLNREWADWRNNEGFITDYLKNLIALDEKRHASLEDLRQPRRLEVALASLNEFYQQVAEMMQTEGYQIQNILVKNESIIHAMTFSDQAVTLNSSTMRVFDIKRSDFFNVVYDGESITITPVDDKDILGDNSYLDEMIDRELLEQLSLLRHVIAVDKFDLTYFYSESMASSRGQSYLLINNQYQALDDVSNYRPLGVVKVRYTMHEATRDETFALYSQ